MYPVASYLVHHRLASFWRKKKSYWKCNLNLTICNLFALLEIHVVKERRYCLSFREGEHRISWLITKKKKKKEEEETKNQNKWGVSWGLFSFGRHISKFRGKDDVFFPPHFCFLFFIFIFIFWLERRQKKSTKVRSKHQYTMSDPVKVIFRYNAQPNRKSERISVAKPYKEFLLLFQCASPMSWWVWVPTYWIFNLPKSLLLWSLRTPIFINIG